LKLWLVILTSPKSHARSDCTDIALLATWLSTLLSLTTMIKHVVFFKFRPEAAAEARRDVVDQLRKLPEKIDLIRSWEIGEDIMHSARAWDVVEIATFDDLGALETYTRHDDHVELVLKLREICEAVGSVDFEG